MLNYKPAVPRIWLFGIAGLMWSLAGLMLIRLAARWLLSLNLAAALPFAAAGVLSAVIVYKFGFSKIVFKNIDRLYQLPEKPCVFAFQAWKSYLITVVMIVLGITIRHSAIPTKFLSVIYNTIGGALFLSSLHYYYSMWKIRRPALTKKRYNELKNAGR